MALVPDMTSQRANSPRAWPGAPALWSAGLEAQIAAFSASRKAAGCVTIPAESRAFLSGAKRSIEASTPTSRRLFDCQTDMWKGHMQYIRSKVFDVLLVIWTLILSPSAILLRLCSTPTRYLRMVAQIWVNGILLALRYIVGLRYVERGRDNIPNEPCIIIANHQSVWETLALAAIFPDAAFVSKREMLRVPIIGWFLKNYPMIMIERGGGARAIHSLIVQSRAVLEDGRSIIIFPEGTRKSVSDQVVFKRGVEILYSELRRPVLPIAVNSGAFWGADRWMKYNGTITVSYLPPILPGLSRDAFREKAQSMLQAEKDRLITELDSAPWLEAVG
jgi:1-acyl-sn-glycerol-3-phosphate acyltransferase